MSRKSIHSWFVPNPPSEERRRLKDKLSRLQLYADWVTDNEMDPYQPHLDAYREYLLKEKKYAPSSANAHLYSVRGRFEELIDQDRVKKLIDQDRVKELIDQDRVKKLIDQDRVKELIDQDRVKKLIGKDWWKEVFERRNSLTAAQESLLGAQEEGMKKRLGEAMRSWQIPEVERPKIEHRHLDANDIRALLAGPDLSTPAGKRDRAIFALMFTTGLRNDEVCALQVKDLYVETPEGLALCVPEGPDCAERAIPYGELIWVLEHVERWLQATGLNIQSCHRKQLTDVNEPVFRGFYRGGKRLRSGGLSPRSLDFIFNAYPIQFGDKLEPVRPMDLRRAHARLLFEAEFELEDIKKRLGVKDNNTLMNYIDGSEAQLGLGPDEHPLAEHTWIKGQSGEALT